MFHVKKPTNQICIKNDFRKIWSIRNNFNMNKHIEDLRQHETEL